MKWGFAAFVLLILQFSGFGQASNQDESKDILLFYDQLLGENAAHADTQALKKNLESISKNAGSTQRTEVEIIGKVLLADACVRINEGLNPRSTRLFNEAIALAEKGSNSIFSAWTNMRAGFYYYSYSRPNLALPYYIRSELLLPQLPEDQTYQSLIAETYLKNAFFQNTLGNLEKSKAYYIDALRYTPRHAQQYGTVANGLGINYFQLGDVEKAREYHEKTIDWAREYGDEVRLAKALGEMALIHKEDGDLDSAVALLEEDIAISRKHHAERNIMFAQIQLARIMMLQNKAAAADTVLQQARTYAASKAHLKSFEYEIVGAQLELSRMHGDEKKELQHRRDLDALQAQISLLDGDDALNRVKLQAQSERMRLALENERVQKEKQALLKTGIGIIAIMLAFSIVIMFVSNRRKMKLRTAAFEKRVMGIRVEKLQSEQKLGEARNTLAAYSTYLTEKNQQIHELENEIRLFRNTRATAQDTNKGELQRLLDSHLMTDENWQKFKQAFIDEQEEYYEYLITGFPGLTESNLRIILLQRLGMSNAETASLLGVTPDAVKKAKQRLRKKYTGIQELLFDTES